MVGPEEVEGVPSSVRKASKLAAAAEEPGRRSEAWKVAVPVGNTVPRAAVVVEEAAANRQWVVPERGAPSNP